MKRRLRATKVEHGHFRTGVVAEAEAETDALVDVKMCLIDAVKPASKLTSALAEERPPDSGQMNLTAVGMSTQDQVATPPIQDFNGSRVVCQQNSRHIDRQVIECAGEVAGPAPQVVYSRHADATVAARQVNAFIS